MLEIVDPAQDAQFVAEIRDLCAIGERVMYLRLAELAKDLVVKPPMKIHEWAAENIEMPSGKTTRGGKFYATPIQRDLGRVLHKPETEQLVVPKFPRAGLSVWYATTALYYSGHEAADTAYFERSKDAAQEWNNDKVMPMIRSSPRLQHLLRPDTRSGEQDRWHDKTLTNAASIKLKSASNYGSFRAIRAKVVLVDEFSAPEWLDGGKHSEGSKLEAAEGRGIEFPDFKIVVGGTCTRVGECSTTREFEKSDKMEYFMRSKYCPDKPQFFVNEVIWVQSRDARLGPGMRYTTTAKREIEAVWYECAHCKSAIPESDKGFMMETGRFEPTSTDGDKGVRGCQIWAAHSMDPGASWKHIARAHQRTLTDPSTRQTFANLFRGKAWEEPELASLTPSELQLRAIDLPPGIDLPSWVKHLYLGADGQGGVAKDGGRSKPPRVECVVIGVGEDSRRFVVGHWVFSHALVADSQGGGQICVAAPPFGELSAQMIWDLCDRDFVREDGVLLRVSPGCVDIAGLEDHTPGITFCHLKESKRRNLVPIRGASEGVREAEILPAKLTVHAKSRKRFSLIGTQAIKNIIGRTLELPEPDPESWSFPKHLPPSFYVDFLAEKRVVQDNGTKRWENPDKQRVSGEVWDATVYAVAAEMMDRAKFRAVRDALAIAPEAAEAALLRRAERQAREAGVSHGPSAVAPSDAPAILNPMAPAEQPATAEADPEPSAGSRFTIVKRVRSDGTAAKPKHKPSSPTVVMRPRLY